MALTQYLWVFVFVVLTGLTGGLLKTILELRSPPRRDGKWGFVNDPQEYLSVWEIAHQWERMDPAQADRINVPIEIKRRMKRVLQGYFRNELPLRRPDGYRLPGQHAVHAAMMIDKHYEKLWDDLGKDVFDTELLDCLFVRRGEILQWCAKEFIEPPLCWALPATVPEPAQTPDDGSEDMRWYKDLSELRRKKIACLELAQHIWKHDGPIGYEAVRTHPLMKQTGLLNVFTPGSFKNAARDFAPDKVKNGGRPRESST